MDERTLGVVVSGQLFERAGDELEPYIEQYLPGQVMGISYAKGIKIGAGALLMYDAVKSRKVLKTPESQLLGVIMGSGWVIDEAVDWAKTQLVTGARMPRAGMSRTAPSARIVRSVPSYSNGGLIRVD